MRGHRSSSRSAQPPVASAPEGDHAPTTLATATARTCTRDCGNSTRTPIPFDWGWRSPKTQRPRAPRRRPCYAGRSMNRERYVVLIPIAGIMATSGVRHRSFNMLRPPRCVYRHSPPAAGRVPTAGRRVPRCENAGCEIRTAGSIPGHTHAAHARHGADRSPRVGHAKHDSRGRRDRLGEDQYDSITPILAISSQK